MASYRIVCVTTEEPHRHIVDVGTGSRAGAPSWRWSVDEVRSALAAGDAFYTVSASGERAAVHPDTCSVAGCSVKTIRSAADAGEDNDLDNLQTCIWS
jgi:hypothetical protein